MVLSVQSVITIPLFCSTPCKLFPPRRMASGEDYKLLQDELYTSFETGVTLPYEYRMGQLKKCAAMIKAMEKVRENCAVKMVVLAGKLALALIFSARYWRNL